ncbi:hypothetical protein [Homoserinimonas hongtaonis]|uniref:Uncharacterized protein n=1 Tax=Homoserinimonas hongtaonis TaxID=2079791 RepID=A0A2U1SWV3_9MICO|nr:hypothetical protein [Salinibacterium hongtaonis]AWB88705.1 hypothetical protein C2138_03320 [Salinibacterium hongtaonis]PWB96115.1 hypothetical protein DF220_12085 [Salinibacterium hongtaonis]
MEMLFAVLGGLFLSFGVHFAVGRLSTRGMALLPAIGTAVSAVVWSALTWLGMPFDGGWIWVASIAAGPLVALAVGLWLSPRRLAADEELFEKLARG